MSINFIELARKVHGLKYDYSNVLYLNRSTKIDIICFIHGVFKQRPHNHLRGQGCPKCFWESEKYNKLTTDDFIKKAIKKHGDKYDYFHVNYIKSNIKVKILCPIHGLFEQLPNNHLRGMGCLFCAMKESADARRLNTQAFIEKAKKVHANIYDYSITNYTGSSNKIKILCQKHGVFEQNPYSHLSGKGCPLCGRWSLLNTDKFIERAKKIHGEKYIYSSVNYINSRIKVKIICSKHGIFEQTPNHHLKGSGCPVCLESQGEKKISLFLDFYKISYEREKSFKECKYKNPLFYDFYIKDLNICIEFDGLQHFIPVEYFGGEETFKKIKECDSIKTEFCNNYGVKLLRISYKEEKNINLILNNYFKQCVDSYPGQFAVFCF